MSEDTSVIEYVVIYQSTYSIYIMCYFIISISNIIKIYLYYDLLSFKYYFIFYFETILGLQEYWTDRTEGSPCPIGQW